MTERMGLKFRKEQTADPSGFYQGLIQILDAEPVDEARVPQLMALDDMVGYYRATIRLIEYDMGLNNALKHGNVARYEKLKRARRSEEKRFKNFSTKRDFSVAGHDQGAAYKNALYSKVYDYWPSRRAIFESEQFALVKQNRPHLTDTQAALATAKNVRNTLGKIRDKYHARVIQARTL